MSPAITVLLRLYPRDFRVAYGPLIALQVRDELRSARGPITAARIITDVIRGAAVECLSAYVAAAPDADWCPIARAHNYRKLGSDCYVHRTCSPVRASSPGV
jgi:hypothetical protein